MSRTAQRQARPPHHEPAPIWWKAPLIGSLAAPPLMMWEYGRPHDYSYGEPLIMASLLLLLTAWLLPRRQSVQALRKVLSWAAVAVAVLPTLLLIVLAVAMGWRVL